MIENHFGRTNGIKITFMLGNRIRETIRSQLIRLRLRFHGVRSRQARAPQTGRRRDRRLSHIGPHPIPADARRGRRIRGGPAEYVLGCKPSPRPAVHRLLVDRRTLRRALETEEACARLFAREPTRTGERNWPAQRPRTGARIRQ